MLLLEAVLRPLSVHSVTLLGPASVPVGRNEEGQQPQSLGKVLEAILRA